MAKCVFTETNNTKTLIDTLHQVWKMSIPDYIKNSLPGAILESECDSHLQCQIVYNKCQAKMKEIICPHCIDPNLKLLSFCMKKFNGNYNQSKKLIEKYTKFIVLKKLENDLFATKLSPSSEVDELWHYHILNTVEYSKLNRALFGNSTTIIHHNPDGAYDGKREERLRYTEDCYSRHFGSVPEKITKQPRNPNTIVIVKDINHTPTQYNIDLNQDTTLDLKSLIQKNTGIPDNQQRLIFNGKQLEDLKELVEYRITQNSVIRLVLRLTGC